MKSSKSGGVEKAVKERCAAIALKIRARYLQKAQQARRWSDMEEASEHQAAAYAASEIAKTIRSKPSRPAPRQKGER